LVDKECAICFESLDTDITNIVELPCKCSNSTYHIACIVRMLESGENKNLCPHCRTVFPINDAAANNDVQRDLPLDHRRFVYIFVIHIFSNTLMNLISIGVLKDDYKNKVNNVISKILIAAFFSKVVFNAFLLFTLKYYNDNLHCNLSASYSLQTIMLVLLICFVSSVKMTVDLGFLLANNLFFFLSDLSFRIFLEHCS